ncbi:MAG TPA: hypothetical protein VNB59_00595 [Solirubrobacterales bacterium]|nr:hypothetical protein [Solirubrobacterales bacterium]
MVFDIRGRRKVAVKVVYAVLALLMGASLFLVVGPLNVGELFNSNSSTTEASKQFEEQADRLEAKLRKEPENSDLRLALTRAQVNAGNAGTEVQPTGEKILSPAAVQAYQEASQSWSEYLKATKEPNAGLAQLVAPMFLTLAEVTSGSEVLPNIQAAAAAQQIVAEQRPTLNSLSTLAIYQMYTLHYKKAEATAVAAKKLASTKFERENFDNQLKEVRARAEAFKVALAEFEKESKAGGGKPQALENPLGGLGEAGGAGLGE